MQTLEGRTALVTGASGGIGAAIARSLAGAGARVVLAARRLDKLRALSDELPGAQALELDVRDADAVERALADAELDVVVPNAGLARGVAPSYETPAADVDEMVDTNVKGVLNVLRAALPPMIARGHGDVVLLGSVAGYQVYPGGSIYCATKYAVRALYESLRLDAAGKGVRFSTVNPGLVETGFSEVRFRGDAERAAAVYRGFDALTPDDVAEAVQWIVTRPAHVNVGELSLWPTMQASTTVVTRD
jgi:NADP-dependent 3-hydroxy acid dehydrogenase YdfG